MIVVNDPGSVVYNINFLMVMITDHNNLLSM